MVVDETNDSVAHLEALKEGGKGRFSSGTKAKHHADLKLDNSKHGPVPACTGAEADGGGCDRPKT